MTIEQYLIDVGIRASDNGHEIDNEERILLRDNVEYFKKCYHNDLSAYKALLFFQDYLNGEYNISFIPILGEVVEIEDVYSEGNFEIGDKVVVLEKHEEKDFWVVGNDDPNKYNESLHISNLKEIN